jgi:hypothetical protein
MSLESQQGCDSESVIKIENLSGREIKGIFGRMLHVCRSNRSKDVILNP